MAIITALIAVIIWGVNSVINKVSADIIEPNVIAFYRWFIAWLILTPFMFRSIRRNWSQIIPYYKQIVVLGILGMGLYQTLAYYAAHSITALSIGMFNALIPLLTMLFSIIILHTPPTRGILCGGLLSFLGVTWFITQGQPITLLQLGIGFGELMMLAAAISYALYGVLIKYWSLPIAPLQSIYLQILVGVVILLPNFLLAHQWQLSSENYSVVLFAAIPASIIAPIVWLKSILTLGANKAALFMNISPIVTALVSVYYLNEPLRGYHLIGGVLTLLGVILAQCWRTPLMISSRDSIPTS